MFDVSRCRRCREPPLHDDTVKVVFPQSSLHRRTESGCKLGLAFKDGNKLHRSAAGGGQKKEEDDLLRSRVPHERAMLG
jgi:hypothetical protein